MVDGLVDFAVFALVDELGKRVGRDDFEHSIWVQTFTEKRFILLSFMKNIRYLMDQFILNLTKFNQTQN